MNKPVTGQIKIEKILGRAVQVPDGTIYHSPLKYSYNEIKGQLIKTVKGVKLSKCIDGFITNKYRFVKERGSLKSVGDK